MEDKISTNYYVRGTYMGTEYDLHIGKRSWGWKFLFESHEDLGLTSFEAWKSYLKDKNIVDEYDRVVTFDEFVETVEETMRMRPDGFLNKVHHASSVIDPAGYVFSKFKDFS